MKSRCLLIRSLVLALCLLLVGFSLACAATQTAVVMNPNSSDRLNLRAVASSNGESLGKYYNGVQVSILSIHGDWAYVAIGDAHGYMMTKYLLIGGHSGSVASAMPQAVVANPVASDRLNLRTGPSSKAESIAKYSNGTSVEIMGDAGDWVHVRVGGNTGYMLREYLSGSSIHPSTTPKPTSGSGYAVVNNPNATQHLNLREKPSATAASLGKYTNGTTVALLKSQGDWYQVSVGGKVGYMQADFLALDAVYPLLAKANRAVFKTPYTNATLVVRDSPSGRALATYNTEVSLQVLGRAGTWLYVQAQGGITGYVPSNQVWIGNDSTTGQVGVIAVVCNPDAKDRLNLRAQASSNGRVLDKLFNGVQVEILDYYQPDVPGWHRVRVAGRTGYVQSEYLDIFRWGAASSW